MDISFQDNNQLSSKLKMAQVLKELIKSKNFSKITVSDIVSESGINRNTFYYHFENIYDLLYWTYEQEVKNIIEIYRKNQVTFTNIMSIVLDYIDENLTLCQTACDSLGEAEMKNMFERDLKLFTAITIEYFLNQKNASISEDFKNYLIFDRTSSLSSQITWYIKYNKELDKEKFRDFMNVSFYNSLEACICRGIERNL